MNAHSKDECRSILCSSKPCGKGEMVTLCVIAHWRGSVKKIKLMMNIALILAPEDMQKIQRKQDVTSLM